MTLMALNYEGDGLQPNCSKENCQEGGVFRPRITHDLDRGDSGRLRMGGTAHREVTNNIILAARS